MQHYRSLLSADRRGGFIEINGHKRRHLLPLAMLSLARIIPEPPPTVPPVPSWARQGSSAQPVDDAMFFAGGALAAVHPIARSEHPLGQLWRQRLALANAAVLARQGGRTEDEAALRDAWYLRRETDDPGPGGCILKAWRYLGEQAAMAPTDWMLTLSSLFELRFNEALEDVVTAAAKLAAGQRSAVAAAAEIAAISLRVVPDSEPLALWLADIVLAHRLKWPMAVPLLAGQLRRAELRAAGKAGGPDETWARTCALAYARAAAAAVDLYADLVRRAHRLLASAPKLRAKDADMMVAILLMEDAQAAGAGRTASDRSTRRLFERLVSLGAVRELTGRPTFRLYGL
ncbi:hypothetical protein ABIF79_011221 [Bradyrhizobium japonicum]